MSFRKHSKQKFVPNFSLEKHKSYAAAFKLKVDDTCLDKYYNHFLRFLKDEQILPSNPEDIVIFRHFVFDSDFGSIHISFVRNLIRNINDLNFNWTIKILSKYIGFIGAVSSIHQADIFDTLFRDYPNQHLLEALVKNLLSNDKILFLEAATHYINIMSLFPKFKLYLLFS